MKQKLDALMMKMSQFFPYWDKVEDLSKHTEYDIARKMINVIEKENKKKHKLHLVKGINNVEPKDAG